MRRLSLLEWIVAGFFLAAVPHAEHIPAPALAFFFLLSTVFFLQHVRRLPALPGALRHAFTLSSFGLVYVCYRSWLGLEPSIAFVAMIGSLKLHELKSKRDLLILNWLSTLLVLGEVVFLQSLWTTIFSLLALTVILYNSLLLNAANRLDQAAPRLWARMWGIFLATVPIAAVLFLVFPRLQINLFSPFTRESQAHTGFHDELRPGDVAELAKSDEVQFRVSFPEGKVPSYEQMYWRGAVLTGTDGENWVKPRRSQLPLLKNPGAAAIVQEIMLEPTQSHWLFGLEDPAQVLLSGSNESSVRRMRENAFESRERISRRIVYRVYSLPKSKGGAGLEATDLRRGLQLPPKIDPRISELAEEFRSGAKDNSEILARALDYFRQGGFEYTLQPPRLGRAGIADFIFQTKKGFCEHFASGLAILLRAAKVPSRVVVGYQGGAFNGFGNYWMVRGLDAHAWVEVWIPGEGWVRADPTAIVVPQRISQDSKSLGKNFAPNSIGEFLKQRLNVDSENHDWRWFLSESAFFVDNVNNQWNQFLAMYDWDYQKNLIARWSAKIPMQALLALIFGAAILAIALVLGILSHRNRVRLDPLLSAYRILLRRLAKHGIEKKHFEGPLDFSRRAEREFPEAAEEIRSAVDLYMDLRYGNSPADSANVIELEKRIKRVA